MMPELVLINQSEDDLLNGLTARVKEIRRYKEEVDYRVELPSGCKIWVPSENTIIIQ